MSPLRIEAKELFNFAQTEILTPIDAEEPAVKKVDQEGKETQIEPGKTYPLSPGEVLIIPDALQRRVAINTDLGLRVSKEPSGWIPWAKDPKEDEVSIHTIVMGFGLTGDTTYHPALREGRPSITTSETIQAIRLKSPVTVWANNKPIVTISWSKEK